MSERYRATRLTQPREAGPGSPTSAERRRSSQGREHDQQRHSASEDSPGKTKAQSLFTLRHGGAASSQYVQVASNQYKRGRPWSRSVWSMSLLTFLVTSAGIALLYSIVSAAWGLHCDTKGCRMSYMRPQYYKFDGFDTEHTRFASKYSLFLYREHGVDNDHKVSGIPVLFIPGNAGSYKQVRPIAAETATYYHEVLRHDTVLARSGVRNLDFFSVDFNEDFTAFHGQTMLDQAEYLNEAVRYILSLYSDPSASRRDPRLPDPTSVIILGHSMGGIVARTMLIMPNYQTASINTIVTMSTPHARPPVTFDSQIVKIYDDINGFWRHSFAANRNESNPLEDITLISIAGGGLDTVVPSDYCGMESIVPETHGFTVFTSSIPNVWTSMDHQAIMWCDQFRKVISKTLLEIVDNRVPTQTKPHIDRMAAFKKWLLTGMEQIADKVVSSKSRSTLLTLNEDFSSNIVRDERFVLRELGGGSSPLSRLHLLSVPPNDPSASRRFTLLSDRQLSRPGQLGGLEVLLCQLLPVDPADSSDADVAMIDLSEPDHGSSRLTCQNVAADVIPLPASTKVTQHPFARDGEPQYKPLSYLEYDLSDLVDYAFVAILDKTEHPAQGWVMAEFSDKAQSHSVNDITLSRLTSTGLEVQLPPNRPMVVELQIPSLQSSLLSYDFVLDRESCATNDELFAPLLRHYMTRPYESKYFVNVNHAEVSLHGTSPFVPPPSDEKEPNNGLSFQLWTDPTCESKVTIRLSIDPMASLGKLYIRYRTVFAAFPLLVVAMVLRKQFLVYGSTGMFITFSESMEMCLKRSLPLLMVSLTCLSVSVGHPRTPDVLLRWLKGYDNSHPNFGQNDLLTGTNDPFFWFLVPMIGVVCTGVCVVVHYFVLLLVHILSSIYGFSVSRQAWSPKEVAGQNKPSLNFTSSTRQRRLLATVILLCLISTTVPHQFGFVVACLVQLSTNVRAFWHARETPSLHNTNFSSYAHSIFLLMFWILPVNLPTLVVWIRNLAVHWFMPFSSHHNVLSILPFILLVETMTTGSMIPRVTSPLRHGTNAMLFGVSLFAAIYGVSHAYVLHHLVNLIVAWFVALHIAKGGSWRHHQWSKPLEPKSDIKAIAIASGSGISTGARSPSLSAIDPVSSTSKIAETNRHMNHQKSP